MRGGVSKPRAHRSRLRLSKASQENRPDVTASKTPELPQSHRDRSSVDGGLVEDTTLAKVIKRPLCTNDCSPTKRARLTQTETRRQPPRRSARLQGQQPPGSAGSIRPSRASVRRQIEASAETLTSERPGLTRRNPQLEGEVRQTKDTETEQQPNLLQRPSTTPPEVRVEGQERVSPTVLLQKRKIDSDGDDNGHQLKRVRLTYKNLAEFNKMAKKKGTASVSAPPQSIIESSSTKTTSTTTSGFAIQARKNGILTSRSKPPANLKDIRERYNQPRGTASPTESVYEDYVDKVGVAYNEATMVVAMSGKMLKDYPREGYQKSFNQAFTGFPKDADFNSGLSAPQPDFTEGLEMEEYRPFPIDEHVKGAVIYKDDPRSITLPHIAGEWKGRGKDMEEARLQSAYDGAALVYARNQALSYLGKSDPPGYAEVTTFTTDGTNLNLFAHYATRSEDGMIEYHQYPVKSTNLVDSHQEHVQGRRGLRNEQDHARKQSRALRDQLKEHWKQRRGAEGAPLPVADGTCEETNGDEEAGYEIVEQPCQPTPAASSQPYRASGSVSSSRSLPPTNGYVTSSGGQKRKASFSSQVSSNGSSSQSKYKSYWKKDPESGRFFHKHSDGRVTWLDDDGN